MDVRICVFEFFLVICYIKVIFAVTFLYCFIRKWTNAFKMDVLVGCEEEHIFKMAILANVV